MPRHSKHPSARRCAPALAASLCALLLSACASKGPQGYGVAEPSAAQQAQQQMEKAEQSTQLDAQQTYLNLIAQMQQANQWYASLAHTDAFERQYGNTPQLRLMRADAQRNTAQIQAAQSSYESLLTDSNSSLAGWELRSNSSAPSHSSSPRIRRLKAGWELCRSSAAREKLPVAARARKSSSQIRFMGGSSDE